MMLATIYGFFDTLPGWLVTVAGLGLFATLAYRGARFWVWTAVTATWLVLWGAPTWLWMTLAPIALIGNLPPLRTALISARVLKFMRASGFLPVISETERTAIEAGTTWVDAELFSGRPDLDRLLREPYPDLSETERAFLETEVDAVCAAADDWQIWSDRDMPESIWAMLREKGFFGMIIPTEYGGLGLSPSANSAVVARLASRSLPLAITVMVPNSLGPAELLIHYGTDEQKNYWLPRLASGEVIPCFALTEPNAGSDAGAIQANGEVFRDENDELRVRLNWDKRYITLAAISNVLGLAFNLRDPEGLLGGDVDLGITCALIPTETEGVVLGRRHDPLGVPFYNCPTRGDNVVVPIDAIIGGAKGAGNGWRMLMECLAAGRGISLPATSVGGAQLVTRAVGAYASVRQQFGLSIGRFEGVEEGVARIAGFNYVLEAMRRYTCGGLDDGAKPAVVTAMAKYHATELYRKIINDGMDVMGGAAISRGPRNVLAHGYTGCPISITVEGANILTRTLMIFGQGAIRCHPYAYDEITALMSGHARNFDRAFWGHVGHVLRNATRAGLLSLTRGWLSPSPVAGASARYWRRLAWASASFANMADLAMATLGGDLKRKEKLTGRFADCLSWLYLGTAVLRRFHAEGCRKEDEALMRWSMEHAFAEMQTAFDGIYQNFRVPVLGALCRGPLSIWHRLNRFGAGPDDRLAGRAAQAILQPGALRDRQTAAMHVPGEDDAGVGRLDRAMVRCADVEPVIKKIKDAVRQKTLPRARPVALLDAAVEKGIVSADERSQVLAAEEARADAVAVDCYTLEEYLGSSAADGREASSEAPATAQSRT